MFWFRYFRMRGIQLANTRCWLIYSNWWKRKVKVKYYKLIFCRYLKTAKIDIVFPSSYKAQTSPKNVRRPLKVIGDLRRSNEFFRSSPKRKLSEVCRGHPKPFYCLTWKIWFSLKCFSNRKRNADIALTMISWKQTTITKFKLQLNNARFGLNVKRTFTSLTLCLLTSIPSLMERRTVELNKKNKIQSTLS